MARTPKKKEYPDLICGIPRANLEQFARFICPYVEAYYADENAEGGGRLAGREIGGTPDRRYAVLPL